MVEEDWLDTGLRILKRMSPEGGEYLVGDGLSIGEMDTNKMISYQEAVILSMEAMSSMKGAEEGASFSGGGLGSLLDGALREIDIEQCLGIFGHCEVRP